MSVDELGEVLQLKSSYIKTHWNVIVSRQEKRGVKLYKVGRGDSAQYGIQFSWDDEPVWSVDAIEMI